MYILKGFGISILVLSLLLIGCDADVDDNSTLISDIDEIGIELESVSYRESDLPEIWHESHFKLGRYKMSVGEAYICEDEYIYFQRKIDSNNNGLIDSEDNKIRIYLDPLFQSNVDKFTTFGTLLTEYSHRVVIDIIEIKQVERIPISEINNACLHHRIISLENPSEINISEEADSIAAVYLGRLISIFEYY